MTRSRGNDVGGGFVVREVFIEGKIKQKVEKLKASFLGMKVCPHPSYSKSGHVYKKSSEVVRPS